MASMVPQNTIDQITQTRDVIGSAVVLIDGIGARLQAAKDEALALGATEAELAPVQVAVDALAADKQLLVNAVAANTPGGPPVPAGGRKP